MALEKFFVGTVLVKDRRREISDLVSPLLLVERYFYTHCMGLLSCLGVNGSGVCARTGPEGHGLFTSSYVLQGQPEMSSHLPVLQRCCLDHVPGRRRHDVGSQCVETYGCLLAEHGNLKNLEIVIALRRAII